MPGVFLEGKYALSIHNIAFIKYQKSWDTELASVDHLNAISFSIRKILIPTWPFKH